MTTHPTPSDHTTTRKVYQDESNQTRTDRMRRRRTWKDSTSLQHIQDDDDPIITVGCQSRREMKSTNQHEHVGDVRTSNPRKKTTTIRRMQLHVSHPFMLQVAS